MISIKKCENISERGYTTPVEAYMLFDEGNLKLACIFELRKNKTHILDIKTFSDVNKMYYDAVIRTVAAYSLSNGIEKIVSRNKNTEGILIELGFEKEKSLLSAKSALLLVHQCGE